MGGGGSCCRCRGVCLCPCLSLLLGVAVSRILPVHGWIHSWHAGVRFTAGINCIAVTKTWGSVANNSVASNTQHTTYLDLAHHDTSLSTVFPPDTLLPYHCHSRSFERRQPPRCRY